MSLSLVLALFPSPVGDIRLVSDADGGLRALDFDGHDDRMQRLLRLHYGEVDLSPGPAPAAVARALSAYFDGDLSALDAVPTTTGGTDFQRSVWAALRDIPPGETQGYGQLAARIGRPSASRAVGAANGANPVAVLIPCHRVIRGDGSIGGYAYGTGIKAELLAREKGDPGGQ